MKKHVIYFFFLIVSVSKCLALDTLRVKSKITNVTIFFNGAQITRHSELKAAKGKHMLLVDQLPQEVNPKSIQVNGVSGCRILSVKHEVINPNENKKSAEETAIEEKIEAEEMKLKEINNKQNVFDLEEKLLIDNSNISKKDDGTTVTNIKEAADFYRSRLNEIRQGKLNLSQDLKDGTKRIQDLNAQLNELTVKKRKAYSRILITLDAEKDTEADMSMTYTISSAGWEPLYDFRVDDIAKPLAIVYNANVYQSSGEDWNNVNVKLSTSNPSLSGEKPNLEAWYLGRPTQNEKKPETRGICGLKGTVLDTEKNEAVPFASIALFQDNELVIATTTDLDGQYLIKPLKPGKYTVKISCVGFNSVNISGVSLEPDKTTTHDFMMQMNKVQLSEVVVTDYKIPLIDKSQTQSGRTITSEEIRSTPTRDVNSQASLTAGVYQRDDFGDLNMRGSRSEGSSYHVESKMIDMQTTNFISNSLKTVVANLEYTIEIPYSIPSDGKDYGLKIKEVTLPVNYVYHSVPKLESDVFLTAEITDWSQLNLLSGKSGIYYQGTFTGESYIDVNHANDTLSISLGRDKNIIVKREGNKEVFDKRISANNIKETIGWNITVKNNKTNKIKIIVEDQYPLSERKSMEVERLDHSTAKLDEKTGKLSWDIQLEQGDKQVVNYKYSVKYPKYVSLSLD